MANVKVAIRVRPLNSRETLDGGRLAVQVEDKVVRVRNMKLEGRLDGRVEGLADSRERLMEFGFDYCYWSVDPSAPNFASQEEVFQDLGVCVLSGASEGYNVCLFAYGQTGSGKTYTMMGTPDSIGLTPRICQGLFRSADDAADEQSCRVEISFLEIYNERVRDLLRGVEQKKPAPLRVREHPEKGPYVQGLSQHTVTNYKQAVELLEEGIANRITAATHNHDASSRSHAIFTIQYTQAIFENNLPSEIVSKINLVDLAGSERADPHYCRDRITEGANINKSLVTLGIVISALAQNSQMFSSSQSINSVISEGEGSTIGSQSSSLSGSGRRHCFIPYRDSVLTWLLKDSLGGNSKTIMIATVSPSSSSYSETLSTLRYAAHARNIVNKPRVNEDANVRLIRELREEIDRLKSMLLSFEMQGNLSPSLSDEREGSLSDIVLQNELKVEQLTKDWSDSWYDKRALLEHYSVDINQEKAGVLIQSLLPHLIALEPDVLCTGVTFYHLREGVTRIGPQDENLEDPHIVLPEGCRCEIENHSGVVTLKPVAGNICMVSEREVTEPFRLAQGAVITLGRIHKFRFNHPAEAAVLRERRRNSEGGLISTESDSRVAGCNVNGNGADPRQRLEEQQWYIQCLREAIRLEQKKAERDLEREQARLQQQHTDIQKWIVQEKQRLAVQREKGTLESGVQTDLSLLALVTGSSGVEESRAETVSPLFLMGERKRVVQEELLKHHTLRRAENRVRRKRLHYQLEKIARKRHLLEAKRELQRLENELLKGGDEALSPELGYPFRSRGRPLTLRRHSFSADLLSRLYPQHNPIFSQFLKRNTSSASLSGFTCTTKSVFDECLQDQKIRRRSNTMPSRYQRSSSWQSSSESLKSSLKEARSAEMTETKAALSRLLVKKNASDQDKLCLDPTSKATRKVLPIIKQLTAQKGSVKGTKSLSQDRSKGLETIRKVFSRSVGPGIKTALAKVFRKPPSGSHGSRSVKSLNKTIGQSDKTKTAKGEKCSIKSTKSYECLEQLSSLKYLQQRHWHSTETLTNTTNKLVEVRKEPVGWVGEDDRNGSSDCDSIYSLDSLSSAYATALAKQLKQEECDFSEAESDNSQMSQDSLVMESSAKDFTARPAHILNKVSSHLTFGKPPPLCSSQPTTNKEEMEISKEVPAEAFWSSKFKMESDKGMAREISTLVSECRPCNDASIKEPDVLAFTDAWSSTDAVDSPRIISTSGHSSKQDLYTPRENSFQSLTSLELSDNMNISEDQSSPRSDSTQGDIATLEEQSNTSFENTLILNSNESDLSFITVQKSVEMLKDIKEPTTNADTSSDDVAHTNKPTNNLKLLEYTATEELMIHSFSKDGDISTGMDTLQGFQDNSSRKDQPIRGDNQSGYQAYPGHSSLKSDDLRSGQLLLCHGSVDTEVKNSEAWQGLLNVSHIGMEHHSNIKEDVQLNKSNGKTFEECHEDYDCVYSKQCTKIATKDNALTIEQSKKHDENVTSFDNEHCVVRLLSDPVTIGQMNKEVLIRHINPPKKCNGDVSDYKLSLLTTDEEQSACSDVNSSDCSTINSELLTKLTTFEDLNIANKMENSNEELEMKEIKCASDAHKAVTNRDHSNISRNDSSECDGELTTTNSEFENIYVNCKEEDKKGAIQIMERKMFNNRYFQMSDSAINDKISEVVKQHFTMSLREDSGEDLKSDTTKENISSAQLEHLKSKKSTRGFEYKDNHGLLVEGNGLQAKSSMAKSEFLTDNTTEHLANYNTQTKSRQSTTIVNETPLSFIERSSTNKGDEQVGISDNMTSVEYCAIEAQGPDGQNGSKSVVSHDSKLRDSTKRLDASKTVQKKDFTTIGNMERGKVTVINPMISCMFAQESPSPEQTNMLDQIREIDQQNAQMVNNTTKSLLDLTKTQENTFDSKLLRHLKLFSETLCSPNTLSSESNIPQVSLPFEATGNHIGVQFEGKYINVANTLVESAGAMLPNTNSEGQIKRGNINSISPNSVMDQSHDNHHVSLSKLAFYEFGPGILGKDRRSASPDKMGAQHPLGNSTISIGICGDENKEKSVDQIYHSHSSDDIRKGQILLDFNQAPQLRSTSQSQMDSVLKTCISKNTPQDFPQSENQLQMMTKSQDNNDCMKGEQNCFNQYVKNDEPSALQKPHSTEPDKDMVKPSITEVYRNAKQTTANQNQNNYTFKSKKEEHFTTVDASKHVDNKSHNDEKREKQKRYRKKAHFKAPSSSSTDSTHDLSLDEGDASKMHVPVKGHYPKCALQTPSRQNPVVHNRLRNPPLGKKSTSLSSATSLRSLQTLSGLRHTQQLENETTTCKGVHGSTEKMQKGDDEDIHLRRNASIKDQQLQDADLQARDSAMHFVSSDINPFIHTRTAMGLDRAVHKNQAFGSAANISSKNSPLNSPNKNITRCCSVDNGLNIQNSPFSSHLSTYANNKGLSSTLSSNEGSRDQISSGPLLMTPPYCSNGSNKKTIIALKCDSKEELCHSSGQVDEIVLVCSSKYDSQKNGHPSPGKCDHGVQTIEVDKDLKRRHCHRRSSTQTPVSKPGIGAPNTWTSLQNMSEHLSDLIYDTSDLLGNIQCMRTGERPPRNERSKNCFKFSTVNSDNKYKRDCSTQTLVDIGIQTETAHASKNAMAHEVNVIVKVIGSETCNVSQLDGNTKIFRDRCVNEPDFERIKSLPDLRLKTSKAAGSQNSVGSPPKVVSLEKVAPDQTLTSLEGLQDNLEDSSLVDKQSSSIYPGGIQSSSTKGEKNPTCQKSVDLRNSCNKKALLMDRASSPILTVKAARYAQQCPNNQRSTNRETTEKQNTTANQYTNVKSVSPQNIYMLNERKRCSHVSPSEPQRKCLSPPSSTVDLQSASSSVGPQSKHKIPGRLHLSSCNNRLTYGSSILEQDHKSPEYTLKNWDNLNQNTPQHQEDDVMSIVPSECNTDVLLSINPLRETSLTVEHQCIPDDLPMHNKFTNWSGINQQPSSTHNKINRLPGQHLSPNYLRAMESERPEPLEETDRKTREIVKLRKEREQVLASVHLDMSPHKLTVELTEAKLHYGQGETDTLLKILKCGSKEEPPAFTKQELIDRHKKSIESLRKERDVRLQMCRRARSLSPGNNRISPSHEREHSQRISDLPSRRREYLQQLRQEIVETSRREGQCPSDIELLLRDYSRAREEARAEIARARHRLRERTEQEKRRIQQQALAQAVKDDLRFRTRISNSTLCTGSNLSLSSGPTSGYNSSNAATLKDNTSPTIQINGVPEFKVRTRPPVIPLQTSKAQRRWLSVQDVSQETFVTEYESSSTPSSPPCARQRTLSFGSPSSISASYQDIADCTLIYLASGGDVRNLLAGKATSQWRHQGVERGVQIFHKATAKTTAHGFLGAMELERPLDSLWYIVRDHSKTHLYHESVRSAWTQPLDECNQLVYLLTDTSNCQLKQPRDFCCLSTESKQDDMWVLAMQSIFEETMPRPSVDTVRGEMLPSAWIFQPSQRNGQEVTTVIYMLQVDLGTPSLAPKMLNTVSRKQAAVIADLNAFLSL
ncbi:uncharacterized protein [Misgurnus anguillicaudatus]|uniref:uncharacterized protein n=1 Tax=Misgurnus anguillicaudatus TaxID=75329 RepID=UPI003CCF8369